MGLYINGVEMPKAQFKKSSTLYHVEGTIFVYPDGKARVELSVDYKERKSYPLVHVPPHGRLGDLDELSKELKNLLAKYPPNSVATSFLKVFASSVALTPTIIPAELPDQESKS